MERAHARALRELQRRRGDDRGVRADSGGLAARRRTQRHDRDRVRRHGRAADPARHLDAGRHLQRLRGGRVLRRCDDPGRRRAARALHAAGPAPARRGSTAARAPGSAPRGRRRARLRRARLPEPRPRCAGASVRARVDRARRRPRLLRNRRLARVPHVPAHAAPGRPARRRRDDVARGGARRVAAPDLHGSRLVDRPRARGARDRGDRPPGRARPPARTRAVAPAARRPEPVPVGRGGGSVPRRPGRRAHAAARRAGHVHRGAHAPRRAPRRAGRRRARPRARAPPRARGRWPAARHGQALRPRRDPEEAGLADAKRSTTSSRSTPSGARNCSRELGFPSDVRRLVRDHHERLDGSGYPFGCVRRPARPRDADHLRLRRVRRAHLAARLPRRVAARARDRPALGARPASSSTRDASRRSSACSTASSSRRSRSPSSSGQRLERLGQALLRREHALEQVTVLARSGAARSPS